MKIVIDIPDTDIPKQTTFISVYLKVTNGKICQCTYPFQELPKGHGRLIDADEALKGIDELLQSPWFKEDTLIAQRYMKDAMVTVRTLCIFDAQTIIEADKDVPDIYVGEMEGENDIR